MCLKKPVNSSEFLEVSGVGAKKCESYGLDFITAIRNYLNETPQGNDEESTGENIEITEYVKKNAHRLHSVNAHLALVEMCDDFISQLGVDGNRKLLTDYVKSLLINENYLTEITDKGKKTISTTILSAEAGIAKVQKINSKGEEYSYVVFPENAQKFVIDTLIEKGEEE